MSTINRSNFMKPNLSEKTSDEFAIFNLDKINKRELKTAEQMQKHVLSSYLETRVIERAVHLLSAGEEIQKINAVNSIPELLEEDFNGFLDRVVPKMQQALLRGSTEFNLAACTSIKNTAQRNLISPENFAKAFLEQILSSVDCKDVVAAAGWMSTLLVVINILPTEILCSQVFPIFVAKANISKPVPTRVTSSKVLGRLASLLSITFVTKDVLPVIMSLCQDVSADVRASMCRELPNLSRLLAMDAHKHLFSCVVDLAGDDHASVRDAAVNSIGQILPFIPPQILKTTIIPLIKKLFAASIENEDESIVEVASSFGEYCIGFKNYLPLNDKAWFLGRYVHMSSLNITARKKPDRFKLVTSSDEEELTQRLTQCRLQCAYNLPAMVLFSADLRPEYSEQLPTVLHNLASDSYYLVRRSIAAGFHELLKLQPKWFIVFKNVFIKLLKDHNDAVLEALVPHVGHILVTFLQMQNANSDKQDSWKDVVHAVLTCEQLLYDSLNWRLHVELLSQLEVIPKCFSPEFVTQNFVPLLIHRCLVCRPLPSKMAAVKIILLIMSDEGQAKQKQKLRNKLLELCSSSNFYSRMVFVRAINLLLDISPKLLKELFFLNIVAMADDLVPNIRCAVCRMLPKLKAIACNPYDRKLMAAIDNSLRRLSDEEDKEVLAQMKVMKEEFEEMDRIGLFKLYASNRDTEESLNLMSIHSNRSPVATNKSTIPQIPDNRIVSSQKSKPLSLNSRQDPFSSFNSTQRLTTTMPAPPRIIPRGASTARHSDKRRLQR